jgi:predicted ATPase
MHGRVRRGEEGCSQIRHGIAESRATGLDQYLAHSLGLLAEAHLKTQRIDAGLAAIDEALEIAQRTGERHYEAELHRLKGELLLADGSANSVPQAEQAFARAIAIGQSQRASLFVLRAAMSVGRLWVRLGRGPEARRLVDGVVREIDDPLEPPDATEMNALLRTG